MDTIAPSVIQELVDSGQIGETPSYSAPARRVIAPTMGNIDKINYSHQDMIDFIIANPGISQGDLAKRYGYSQGWVCNVMASDAWQTMMAARRAELVDPVLAATVEERFRGITMKSLQRLDAMLDAPIVPAAVVLKAVELGAKAMGVGGNAAPPPTPTDHLAQLANRLIDLQANVRKGVTYAEDAEVIPAA